MSDHTYDFPLAACIVPHTVGFGPEVVQSSGEEMLSVIFDADSDASTTLVFTYK